VLINTYWVRFDHRLFTHSQAVANTKVLFQAAKNAGVRRIVHVSITNPDIHSDLPYFSGKAELESALTSLGVSYCILRPTVLFGKEDVLINNIAWSLRHLPVFGVFGNGEYKLQPIYVDDLALAAVEKATGEQNEIIQRHWAGDVHLSGIGDDGQKGVGVETSHCWSATGTWLLGLPSSWTVGSGCRHYSSGDKRVNGGTALCGCAPIGHN